MTETRRRGRPRKEDAGDTKALLLEAAMDLFSRHGYAGTSIRAIARQVGLSESVLYAHFESKHAIFEAALAQMGPPGAHALFATVDQDLVATDPPAFVRAIAHRVIDAWTAPESLKFMSFMGRDGLSQDPALANGVRETNEVLAGFFARWAEEGRLPAGLEPDALAFALLSPIGMCRVLWFHAGTPPEVLEAARRRALDHVETFIRLAFGPA
ncbi:TetR/AcrR family transcriptional regulator [Actinocorallia longicatena]|uniref:HTH tetR-type domain-containing protein n=1 Tax=Actinocorallia longicatena TaxID=111803 RepID=A0ABP6QBW7_9ACTN